MSRSRSRSLISGAALVAAAAATGCSSNSETCGPGSAPAAGITATSPAATLTFGNLTGGLNNDCPPSDAPSGVISMTIAGIQTDGAGQLTLCIGRPDLLASEPQTLGLNIAGVQARLVDVNGMAAGCSFSLDTTQPVTGTASATGLCDNGSNAAGFALTLDGSLSLTRTCGNLINSQAITLHGTTKVTKP